MAASSSPNPKLGKSQALNISQATVQRLATLVPSLTTELSPVTVYQPGATSGVGFDLTASAGDSPVDVSAAYGVWVAPDLLGNGQEYYVQVECFGGGGGAGGGNSGAGGGGGGGGEYSCEVQYPVKPGESYGYVVGLPGSGGVNNSTQVNPGAAGTDGGITIFDIAGLGLANGVTANGGGGGDVTAVGIGGPGGTGSSNSIHFDGGQGGTNSGSHASDNPLTLATTTGMFTDNTLSPGIIPCWYMLNETGHTGGNFNDNSLSGKTGSITNYTGGYGLGQTVTPTQVPAFAAAADPPLLPVAQAAGVCGRFQLGALSSPSASITAPSFTFSGGELTVSAWVQCDPTGTWGNTAAGSYAVIAANTQNYSGNAMSGYALFFTNTGTQAAPVWVLSAAVGNGHSRTVVSSPLAATPGSWHQVVLTFTSGALAGTLALYVDGTSAGTATSSYISVPSGGLASTVGMDPGSAVNWFFGSIASIWWANDCLTSSGVSAAFGLASPTGGAGGGASGGPSANGGTGGSASGSTGGAAGTPATQPASLSGTTTEAMSGVPGATGGTGFALAGRLGVSTTTVTQTVAGTYTQELPQGVTQITGAAAWGAGAGGDGGTTSAGAAGGGGGEYAAEAVFTPSSNPFTYVVGAGGSNSSTGAGAGGPGADSFINGVEGSILLANGSPGSGSGNGGTGSTNTTHFNGGGGGSTTSTGAGSGGNSGNPTSAGDVGGSTSNSTGAASPAAQSGSGRGGAGGSNNASGSSGGSPGAGGGGAGAGVSSSNTLTKVYEAVYTAAYYGPDGSDANELRSTSVLWQGGETESGGSFNGNQRSVMVFNSDQISEDFSGYTATGLTLKIVNTHTWYDSGMTIEFDVGESGHKYPSSAPGSWQGGASEITTGTISQFGTGNFGLGAGVASFFLNNETNFLAIGANVASKHAYNLSYYGSFDGGHDTSVEITITGTKSSSGSENSGFGSDGKITFTYDNSAPITPPVGTTGGPYGGGGGGSGDMAASPALQVLTVPFSTAAAYCGVDATGNAFDPYSVNQQNNPASGVTSVLFAGGQAADAASGSKNSVMLLPANLASLLVSASYTVEQVFLTFTNANPNAATDTILEVGYSSDSVLPQVYYGTSLISYVAAVPVPQGAGTITYDITQSGIGTLLQSGVATALILGPGADPTFDAFNAPSGPDFYCSVYGPGAYDSFGNPQFPFLTVVLQKTKTVQQGSAGNGGAILITAINNSNTPIANIQPFATTDDSGNQFAEGYTGPVVAFDPTITTPGNFLPETWKPIVKDGTWATVSGFATPQYRMLPDGNIQLAGIANWGSSITTPENLNSSNPLPAAYRPASTKFVRMGYGNRGIVQINSAGVLSMQVSASLPGQYIELDCIYSLL